MSPCSASFLNSVALPDRQVPLVEAIRRALSDCSTTSNPWLTATEIRERLEAYGGVNFNATSATGASQRVRNALNCRLGPRSVFVSKKGSEQCGGRVYYALRKNVTGEQGV